MLETVDSSDSCGSNSRSQVSQTSECSNDIMFPTVLCPSSISITYFGSTVPNINIIKFISFFSTMLSP